MSAKIYGEMTDQKVKSLRVIDLIFPEGVLYINILMARLLAPLIFGQV